MRSERWFAEEKKKIKIESGRRRKMEREKGQLTKEISHPRLEYRQD